MSGGPRTGLLLVLLGAAVGGCAQPKPAPSTPPPDQTEIEILSVQTPGDLLVGTLIGVDARGLDEAAESAPVMLSVQQEGAEVAALPAIERVDEGLAAEFRASAELVGALGTGTHSVDLVLRQGDQRSAGFAVDLGVTDQVGIFLEAAPQGSVYRNDQVVLRGTGFIAPEEGSLEAELLGRFTREGGDGSAQPVSVHLPVAPAERYSRERGLLRVTTAIGGLWPGHFEGTIELIATFAGGATRRSAALPTALDFEPPTLFAVAPTQPVLGQIVTLSGGGFLGSPDEPDETTLLRLEGQFVNEDGVSIPFPASEAVVIPSSGQTASWGLEVEARGLGLVSSFFGYRRGQFHGTATIVTLKGADEVDGEPVPLELGLAGVRQEVVVAFLPGFVDSLRHFGLASAAAQVEAATLQRMRDIYSDYAVDILTEEPDGFLPSAVAHVEIGGPDPNGLGLLGYDNTPGKDVGNVRLFDTIGGANYETQADGFPGYGGVFIDSFLYWSSHPDLAEARPVGAPQVDALFDDMFDAVRLSPASLDEVTGVGPADRVADVDLAVTALGNMIGETAAHEFGHSLGLAQPYGPPDAYHSAVPGEGCLMDAGADRPLGERAGQPGYAPTHFCADEPQYLSEILPR